MYGLFVQSFSIVSSIVPSVVVLDNSPVEFLRYLHKRVNSPATNIIKTYQVRGGGGGVNYFIHLANYLCITLAGLEFLSY